jgi:stage V sporulation protein G
MDITDIAVVPVDENKLRAYVNITLDNCFMIRGLKIIRGKEGLFVAMPNKQGKNGAFRDVAHPLNAETRKMIETKILSKYDEVLAEQGLVDRGPDPDQDQDEDRAVNN